MASKRIWSNKSNASTWLCARCKKVRSANFCHNCGMERSEEASAGKFEIEDLRQFAREFRTIQQQQFNRAAHLEERAATARPDETTGEAVKRQINGDASDGERSRSDYLHEAKTFYKAAEKSGSKAELIEWAVELLGGISSE